MATLEGGEAPYFLVVGAGLSGAVLARTLAEAGCHCDVFEEQPFVGGGCRTIRDDQTGILVHRKGPHTLHSDDETVWAFVERFSEVYPYRHVKRALTGGELFVSPINLQTLNQFFHTALGPEEARDLVAAEAAPYAAQQNGPPADFEEAGLATIGKRLFDAFYRGYTIKQWGVEPRDLPASVFARVPVRFDYNDSYFRHGRQGQPVGGYSRLIERILDHPGIAVSAGRAYAPADPPGPYRHVFYSGPIDRYFRWRQGRLPYRSVRFEDVRVRAASARAVPSSSAATNRCPIPGSPSTSGLCPMSRSKKLWSPTNTLPPAGRPTRPTTRFALLAAERCSSPMWPARVPPWASPSSGASAPIATSIWTWRSAKPWTSVRVLWQ